MYRCISTYPLIIVLSLLLPCIIILFLHLLSTNHKCTQPCYFPLLLKLAAQKEMLELQERYKICWNGIHQRLYIKYAMSLGWLKTIKGSF
jgi:hypothetical protein